MGRECGVGITAEKPPVQQIFKDAAIPRIGSALDDVQQSFERHVEGRNRMVIEAQLLAEPAHRPHFVLIAAVDVVADPDFRCYPVSGGPPRSGAAGASIAS